VSFLDDEGAVYDLVIAYMNTTVKLAAASQLEIELARICIDFGGRPLQHDEHPMNGTIVLVPSVEPRRFFFDENLQSLAYSDFLTSAVTKVRENGGPWHKIQEYDV
jgi:hypothetical protein